MQHNKIRVLLSVLIVCLFHTDLWAETVIRVRTTPIEPYTKIDSQGNRSGLQINLVHTLLEGTDIRAEFVDIPWNRALKNLEFGELDLLLPLSRTPERETFTNFIGVALYEQNAIFVRRDGTVQDFQTLNDLLLGDRSFGIRENFFYSKEFNNRLERDPKFAAHFEAASTNVNFAKVSKGRMDGCIFNIISGAYLIKSEPEFSNMQFIKVPFFPPQPGYFGVSKKLDPTITNTLRNNYARLAAEGAFEKIVTEFIASLAM